MKLSVNILKKINNPETRTLLALSLKCTDQTIMRYIKENSDNLTKAAAMEVIRKVTGLTESEILEPETTNA